MTIYGDIVGSSDRTARALVTRRTRTVAPADEPVTPDDLKLHARIDDDIVADDDYLETLISLAREHIEHLTGVAMIHQTWRITLDAFPSDDAPIYLPRAPLSSVTSVTYLDEDGASQTLAAADYSAETATDPASWPNQISLAYNESWPSTRVIRDAVTITAVFGFGANASDVPRDLAHAVRMLALFWYEHRAAAEFLQGADIKPIPFAVAALVNRYKLRRFA